MKRNSLLKLTIVIGLSIVLILGLNSFVFAEDDVQWNEAIEQLTPTPSTTTTTTPTPTTTPTTTTTTTPTPTTVPTITPTEAENTANESMPYTGIEDVNTVFALAILIGLAVAVYSLKKVNDYNNI